VVELLRQGLDLEVEQWICQGEVAISSLPNAAAKIATIICPRIEVERKKNPMAAADSASQLLISCLSYVVHDLRRSDPVVAETIEELRTKFWSSTRKRSLPQERKANELVQLAVSSPQWAVDACRDFLQHVHDFSAADPALSTALASEAILAQDWLRPEEEEAWRYL
jgi:hypothetical protein